MVLGRKPKHTNNRTSEGKYQNIKTNSLVYIYGTGTYFTVQLFRVAKY